MTMRGFAQQAGVVVLTALLVDVLAYWLLPDSVAWKFDDYRARIHIVGRPVGYPRDYFVNHPTRGFEIGPGRRGRHELPEFVHDVWSNRLGCFDHELRETPAHYVYFAGDSFTWGYVPQEERFSSLFAQRTNLAAVNCGVTGTGTAHQFDKFTEVKRQIGRPPVQVVLGYYANDVLDDAFHPRAGVVSGWLVDRTYVNDSGHAVVVDDPWLQEQVGGPREIPSRPATCSSSLPRALKCYSLTINLVNALRHAIVRTQDARAVGLDYRGTRLRRVYQLEGEYAHGEVMRYTSLPLSRNNQLALRSWQDDATRLGYRLTTVLIPPKWAFGRRGYYAEVKAFLSSIGVEHLDLSEEFHRRSTRLEQAYWRYDGHLSAGGHRVAAEVLAAHLTPQSGQ